MQSRSLTVDAIRRSARRSSASLRSSRRCPQVQNVRSPLAPGGAGAISKDRHSALVQFSITGDAATRRHEGSAGARCRRPAAGAEPRLHRRGVRLREREQGAERHARPGLPRRPSCSRVPITFLILLFAFGAFVAAGVPVLLAFTAVLGSIGLAALISHVVARIRRDELRDAADGHGGRRRLLALLLEARAGGARWPAQATRRCRAPPRPRARRCSSREAPC